MAPHPPKLIAIAGGSGSGKSTFTALLRDALGQAHVTVFQLDNYYRAQDHLPFERRVEVNYDHPNSIEFDLMSSHLQALSSGAAIDMPEYDFALHTRRPDSIALEPKRVVLIDGIFALFDGQSRALYHHTVFIDAPEPLRLARRMHRDVRERGRTPESVTAQWNATVEPMYRQMCYPTRSYAQTVLTVEHDGFEQFRDPIARIVASVTEGR